MAFFLSLPVAGLLAGAAMTLTVAPGKETSFTSPQRAATLIELFSSEGCSSCPPAETWLARWKNDPALWSGVVPVAFHVDYWDNLGWPDRFATRAYTQRQRDYAARLGQDSVYTPEFVVNGREWRGGFSRETPPAPAVDAGGVLTIYVETGNRVRARFVPQGLEAGARLRLHIALLGAGVVSPVARGENGGRELLHEFVVLGFATSGLVLRDGVAQSGPMTLDPTTHDPVRAVAAWVTREDGTYLQATGGWLGAAAPN